MRCLLLQVSAIIDSLVDLSAQIAKSRLNLEKHNACPVNSNPPTTKERITEVVLMSSESSHVYHKLHFDSFVSILPSLVKSKILQYSLFIFVSYRHDIYYSNQSDTIFHTNAT